MRLLITGIILTLISWVEAWGRLTPFSGHTFFPLWLGYTLTINGLSFWLFGKSLLHQTGKKFIIFFILSIPLWWLFEFLNLAAHNWSYIFPQPVGIVEYTIRASIAFSTVIPALLSTSFLFKEVINKIKPLKRDGFNPSPKIIYLLILLGLISFPLIPTFPYISFPLLWIGVFLILDPINYLLGFPAILKEVASGQWTLPVAVVLSALFTGFWWEMWNFYSTPKWVYTVPYVGFFKIFEMPILGFLGYLPFGLEVYAFTAFSWGISGKVLHQKPLKIIL